MNIVLYTKAPRLRAAQRHGGEGVFLIVTDPLHRKPFRRQVSYQVDRMGTITTFYLIMSIFTGKIGSGEMKKM
jgi:redox-regulated HSP33 family molecular chaperone